MTGGRRRARGGRPLLLPLAVAILATGCGSRSSPPATPQPAGAPVPARATGAAPAGARTPSRPVDGIAVVRAEGYPEVRRQRRQALARRPAGLSGDEVGYYLDVQQASFQQLGDGATSVERRGSTLVLTLAGGSPFESGSSRLTDGARRSLVAVAGILVAYDNTLITVHGHTDATGSQDVNQRLSEARALAVARLLVGEGVDRQRLLVVGHGQSRPVASNENEAGRARNRRVELHFDPIAP